MRSIKVSPVAEQGTTEPQSNHSDRSYPSSRHVSSGKSDLEFALLWFALSATYTGHSVEMQGHAWDRFDQAARACIDLKRGTGQEVMA